MSIKSTPIEPVPAMTAKVAIAAFPKGNSYLHLRDELGTIFTDEDFADLFARRGRPLVPPWRLALVTVLQFREGLPDRHAADAVRARIDWKYLLGLELDDPGFDFTVLNEFRNRLLGSQAGERLLEKLLERCKALGLVKPRGRQRTDATHVLGAIRVMNQLELLGETLRAALNELATAVPEWVKKTIPAEWYERYGRRIEDTRLPRDKAEREAYAEMVGLDGFTLLDLLDAPKTWAEPRELPKVEVLRKVWERHFKREGPIRLKPRSELPPAAQSIESPYDPEARFRSKRDTHWTGYMAVLTETCDDDVPNVITHVATTAASVHEVNNTVAVQEVLVGLGLPPAEHFVDAGFVTAAILVESREERGIKLIGPPRPTQGWQTRVEGAYSADQFKVDWENQRLSCPQGKQSSSWKESNKPDEEPYISVRLRVTDCAECPARALCTRSKSQARKVQLPPREQYQAMKQMRSFLGTDAGWQTYARRSGIEGTISQGVRAFGLRRSRYWGEAKTHLQHVATAAAMNLSRISDWLDGVPRAKTRKSRLARLVA